MIVKVSLPIVQEESNLEETTKSQQFYKETDLEDLLDEEADAAIDDEDEDNQGELDDDESEELADYEDQEDENEMMLAKAIEIIQSLIPASSSNNQAQIF